MKYKSIGCIASNTKRAKIALNNLVREEGFIDIKANPTTNVDLIIVLGGDGFMLHSLHKYMHLNIPFYGMNCGTIGFLLNNLSKTNLTEKIEQSKVTVIHPLKMIAHCRNGYKTEALAINEVALLRQTNQVAKIKIIADDVTRLNELVGDGVMVATSAGSSAYNFSAGGPIIPVGSNLLALTPISPFRPRRWRGALLPHNVKIVFDIIDFEKRPVSAVADFKEVREVISVEVEEDQNMNIKLLFDPDHSLEDRIIREQFEY
ncbi:MAG: NAD kinase [Alphaproteobacteria bacterium]